MTKEFKEKYGEFDVNIMDGTIKYNEDDNETDTKDNDREGL